MATIYLAYRKSGAHPDVQKVIDGLSKEYGKALVHGVSDFPGTETYRAMVNEAVRKSAGMFIITGPEFNSEPDALGRRRLDNPDDPLRIELEAMLKFKPMLMVWVVVGGFTPPEMETLPRSLQVLYRHEPFYFGVADTPENDMKHLTRAGRWFLQGTARRLMRCSTVIALIAIVGSAAYVALQSLALQ